jgi:uncharacterized membrane protein
MIKTKHIMRSYIIILCACILLQPAIVQAESITDFYTHVTVRADGMVEVQEKITYDFEEEQRHGIYRDIRGTHPQQSGSWLKKRVIDIEVLNVYKNDSDVPYTLEAGDTVRIKIGDKDTTVTGTHTYTITYVLAGALSYGSNGTELYYNVTGDEWNVPIANVTTIIKGEGGVLLNELQACYVGPAGAHQRCEQNSLESGVATFTTTSLSTYEGLTIAQSIQSESVAVLIREQYTLDWIGYLGGLMWLIGLGIWAYRFRTKNKVSLPVIAQYEPYAGVLPMYAGVLIDSTLDPQDITAGIMYLAQQGFIKIKATEEKVLWVFNTTQYELTLLRNPTEMSIPMLKQVLTLLFSEESAVGSTVLISQLAKKQSQNARILQELRTSITTELQKDGFLSIFTVSALPWTQLGVIIGLFLGAFLFLNPLFVGIVLLASVGIFSVVHFKHKTRKGYEAVNHMKGFKLFLSVTEKERYTFFNAPQKSPELFMQFLPYAVAFKVEKEWADVFKDITIESPSWYDAGGVHT